MVTGNVEPTLLRSNVPGNQRHRDIDIDQHAALQAMHVIVPLHAGVVAAGLIGERQFLNQAVFANRCNVR